jgi:CDGSH-type Zn-finger protein
LALEAIDRAHVRSERGVTYPLAALRVDRVERSDADSDPSAQEIVVDVVLGDGALGSLRAAYGPGADSLATDVVAALLAARAASRPAARRSESVTVALRDDGPYLLEGPFELIDGDGQRLPIARGNRVELCRCGGSGNKPFCDGTHACIGFLSRVRWTSTDA